MEKLHPRAVIFDLGSTLIEYESISWSQLNILCAENARKFLIKKGYTLPDENVFYHAFEDVKHQYRKVAEDTLVEWTIPKVTAELFKKLNIDGDNTIVDRFFDAYYEPVKNNIYIYDDTLDTLERIKKRIPVTGLISNTIFPGRAHLAELKRFGIESYFDFTIFSSSFLLRKPHPDIFYAAANKAGYAPSECVYVGDRYYEDVTGPLSIGMTPVLKMIDKREYPDDIPDSVRRISTLKELENHLEI